MSYQMKNKLNPKRKNLTNKKTHGFNHARCSNEQNALTLDNQVSQILSKSRNMSIDRQIEYAKEVASDEVVLRAVYKRLAIIQKLEDNHKANDMLSRIKSRAKMARRQCKTKYQAACISLPSSVTKSGTIKLVEDVCMLLYMIFDSQDAEGDFNFFKITIAVVNFLKLRTGQSIIMDSRVTFLANLIKDSVLTMGRLLFEKDITEVMNAYNESREANFSFQSEEATFVKGTSAMRAVLNKYEEVRHSKFVNKLGEVCTYLLSFSIFDSIGEKFVSERTFKAIKFQALKEHKFAGPDFIYCILDTIVFVCERGYQCVKLGSMQPLVHDESKYDTWVEEANNLIIKSKYLGNAEANNIDEHQYLADLTRLIDQGRSISNVIRSYSVDDRNAKRYFDKILADLTMLKHNYITLESAMSERRTPLGVLIDGGSSVAKSTFAKILFFHYGRVRAKPIDDHYRYCRTALDEFWSGYNSAKWCVHFDDVACFKANICKEGDPSVGELIQTINQIPHNPPQAVLEDKGKTPVRAEFVTVSTNTHHMNVHSYYEVPLAVQRRLPIVINIRPKIQYDKNGMMDQSKVNITKDGSYPDLWDIHVYKIVPTKEPNDRFAKVGTYEPLFFFDNIYIFLKWFTERIQSHNYDQTEVMESIETMRTVLTCEKCYVPLQHCVCENTELVARSLVKITEDVRQKEAAASIDQFFCNLPIDNSHMFQRYVEPIEVAQSGQIHDTNVFLELGYQDLVMSNWYHEVLDKELLNIHVYDAARTEIGRWMHSAFTSDDMCVLNNSKFETTFIREFGKCETLLREHLETTRYMITRYWFSPLALLCVEHNIPVFILDNVDEPVKQFCSPSSFARMQRWFDDISVKYTSTKNAHFVPTILKCDSKMIEEINSTIVKMNVPSWKAHIPDLSFLHKGLGLVAIKHIELSSKYPIYWGLTGFGIFNSIANLCVLNAYGIALGTVILMKTHIGALGHRLKKLIGDHPALAKLIMVCLLAYTFSGIIKSFMSSIILQADVETKGKPMTVTPKDLRRKNPWYKKITELTADFIPEGVSANVNSSIDKLAEKTSTNVVRISANSINDDGTYKVSSFNGFCIGGQYYVVPLHSVGEMRSSEWDVRWLSEEANILAHTSGAYTPACLIKTYQQELAIVRLPFMLVRKSMKNFIFGKYCTTGIFNGKYSIRNKVGELTSIYSKRIVPSIELLAGHDKPIQCMLSKLDKPTVVGDCCAPLIVETAYGPFIAGLHIALRDGTDAISICIDSSMYENLDIVIDNAPHGGNISLQALDEKSNLQFHETGSVEVYGTLVGKRNSTFKSKVTKSLLNERMCNLGYANDYFPPPFEKPNTWFEAIKNKADIKHLFTQEHLNKAKKIYLRHLISSLSKQDLTNLHIISQKEALNGQSSVCYLDSIDLNTSGGFGKPGHKGKWVELVESEDGQEIVLTPEDKDTLQQIENTYMNNQVYKPLFMTFPKDEPLPYEKVVVKEQFRLINNGPMVWNIWMRMHFLPFAKLVQENKFKFACAPGMVAQGLEWHLLQKYLTKFGDERIVAGDYSKYDQRMSSTLILACGEIIVDLYKYAGHTSSEDLQAMRVAFYDLAFPTYCQKGDVMQFFGSNSSGNVMTVIINSVVNVLLMILAYTHIEKDDDFFENVNLMTYGDDNIMGVSPKVKNFNHTSISDFLTKRGMTYTMADKSSESIPFSSIFEVEFLKRSFRFEPELGVYLAPLRKDSIVKSLMINVPSRTISRESQQVYIISTALYEFSFYGRNTFEEWRKRLLTWMEELDLMIHFTDSLFPSYDELLERYHQTSKSTEEVAAHLLD